jgi:hypothetical protein
MQRFGIGIGLATGEVPQKCLKITVDSKDGFSITAVIK